MCRTEQTRCKPIAETSLKCEYEAQSGSAVKLSPSLSLPVSHVQSNPDPQQSCGGLHRRAALGDVPIQPEEGEEEQEEGKIPSVQAEGLRRKRRTLPYPNKKMSEHPIRGRA